MGIWKDRAHLAGEYLQYPRLLLGLVVSPAIGERKIIKGQPAVGLPWQLVLVAALVGCLSGAAALAARRFVISGSATDPAGQTA